MSAARADTGHACAASLACAARLAQGRAGKGQGPRERWPEKGHKRMLAIFTPDALLALTLSFIAGGIAGWGLARMGQVGLAWALVALAMLLALGVSFFGFTQPGLRGIGPAMAGPLVIAPIGLAAAVGVTIETLRRRRRAARDEGGPPQDGG